MTDYRVCADAESAAQACAEYLADRIRHCVAENGACHVVLPGGSTPARCLQLLAAMDLPWTRVHWYPGDERCHPPGHPDRNDTMIRQMLFAAGDRAAENLHPIPAELGAEQGAREYARLLQGIGPFDIVLLGMGEDGHTASLFPGNPALEDKRPAVPVHDAPKPPSDRISIGLQRLRGGREKIVLATGAGKRDALQQIRNGETLPINMLKPNLYILDEELAH